MPSQIFHCIYKSQAVENFDAPKLKELLDTAQTLNSKNDLTGFLVFRENYFVQLLEGQEADVKATLARIEKDKRHRNIVIIAESFSDSHIAPNWSMRHLEDGAKASSVSEIFYLLDLAMGKEKITLRETAKAVINMFMKSTSPLQ